VTTQLNVQDLAQQIEKRLPGSVIDVRDNHVLVKAESLVDVAQYCHDAPALALDMLVSITGVDYIGYFEVVYHLVSIKHNHGVWLKARAYGREAPEVPSLTPIWQGAILQEAEVYDLMGIRFSGHPNLTRVFLWEGFKGHPHRKDFVGA